MDQKTLLEKAIEASRNAYAPYSKFKVGVALEDQNGNVFVGCNVENLSFPAGLCAEMTAVGKAVSKVGPALKIKRLVVYTPTTELTTPCGMCRQVISEFATNDTVIICSSDGLPTKEIDFKDLFPDSPIIEGVRL